MSAQAPVRVLVIGGGLGGLTLVYSLQTELRKRGLKHIQITMVEKSKTPGGWVNTQSQPYMLEMGPRAISLRKSKGSSTREDHMRSLVYNLGLESEVIDASPLASKRYIFNGVKLVNAMSTKLSDPITRNVLNGLAKFALGNRRTALDMRIADKGDHILRNMQRDVLVYGYDVSRGGVACNPVHNINKSIESEKSSTGSNQYKDTSAAGVSLVTMIELSPQQQEQQLRTAERVIGKLGLFEDLEHSSSYYNKRNERDVEIVEKYKSHVEDTSAKSTLSSGATPTKTDVDVSKMSHDDIRELFNVPDDVDIDGFEPAEATPTSTSTADEGVSLDDEETKTETPKSTLISKHKEELEAIQTHGVFGYSYHGDVQQQHTTTLATNIYNEVKQNIVLKSPVSSAFFGRALVEDHNTLLNEYNYQDESIAQFFTRNVSADFTESLIDPLVAGIYSGNIHKLSMSSGFDDVIQGEVEKKSTLKTKVQHNSEYSLMLLGGGSKFQKYSVDGSDVTSKKAFFKLGKSTSDRLSRFQRFLLNFDTVKTTRAYSAQYHHYYGQPLAILARSNTLASMVSIYKFKRNHPLFTFAGGMKTLPDRLYRTIIQHPEIIRDGEHNLSCRGAPMTTSLSVEKCGSIRTLILLQHQVEWIQSLAGTRANKKTQKAARSVLDDDYIEDSENANTEKTKLDNVYADGTVRVCVRNVGSNHVNYNPHKTTNSGPGATVKQGDADTVKSSTVELDFDYVFSTLNTKQLASVLSHPMSRGNSIPGRYDYGLNTYVHGLVKQKMSWYDKDRERRGGGDSKPHNTHFSSSSSTSSTSKSGIFAKFVNVFKKDPLHVLPHTHTQSAYMTAVLPEEGTIIGELGTFSADSQQQQQQPEQQQQQDNAPEHMEQGVEDYLPPPLTSLVLPVVIRNRAEQDVFIEDEVKVEKMMMRIQDRERELKTFGSRGKSTQSNASTSTINDGTEVKVDEDEEDDGFGTSISGSNTHTRQINIGTVFEYAVSNTVIDPEQYDYSKHAIKPTHTDTPVGKLLGNKQYTTSIAKALSSVTHSSMWVVNVVFDSEKVKSIPKSRKAGFGFLVPSYVVKNQDGPCSAPRKHSEQLQHPLYGVLGVCFDSDVFPLLHVHHNLHKTAMIDKSMRIGEVSDSSIPQSSYNIVNDAKYEETLTSACIREEYTRFNPLIMTIMIGGDRFPDAQLWTHYEIKSKIRDYLHIMMDIDVEPSYVKINYQHECIPQQYVGHNALMRAVFADMNAAYGYNVRTESGEIMPVYNDTSYDMYTRMYESGTGNMHPKFKFMGTSVGGPAIKNVCSDSMVAAVNFARHIDV